MRRTTQTRIKRITAGVMTALLVLQMTPVAPFASIINAFAAEGDAAASTVAGFTPEKDGNGFVISGWLNNHRAADEDATFTQEISVDAIKAAVDEGGLAKPTVTESDLQKDAKTAADKAVQSAANTNAQGQASELDLTTDSNLVGEAKKAAQQEAADLLAEYLKAGASADNPLTAAIKQALADKGIEDEDAVAEVLASLASTSIEADKVGLGTPAYAATQPQAQEPLVTNVAPNADSIFWQQAPTISLSDNSKITSSDESVVEDVTDDDAASSRTLQVKKSGESQLSVQFAYQWSIDHFDYGYDFSYDSYTYVPSYTFGDDAASNTYKLTASYQGDGGTSIQLDITVDLGTITGTLGSQTVTSSDPAFTGSVQAANANAVSYTPAKQSDTYKYWFEANDIFNDDVAMVPTDGVTAPEMTYSGDPQSVTTGRVFTDDAFNNPELALEVLAGSAFDEGDAKHYTVAYNANGTLTLTPESATGKVGNNDGETSTVTWTLPDGTEVELKVTGIVNPYDLNNLALDTQDFRLEVDQQAVVLADANAKIKDAADAQGEKVESDYYSSVRFDGYPTEGQGGTIGVTFTKAEGADEAYANFSITDPTTVAINPMKTQNWQDTGLKLSATTGVDNKAVELTAENAGSTWIKSTPAASWEGYELSFGNPTVPTSSDAFSDNAVALNSADGIHQVGLYAKDSDGVVSQVAGVTYQLDTLAPALKSAKVSDPYTVQENIFFKADKIDVDLSIVDEFNTGNAGDATQTSSGLNADSITAKYVDGENNETVNVSNSEVSSTGASLYRFTVSGDRDVDTDTMDVTAADNAGNQKTTNVQDADEIPMEYIKLVSDASAPTISASWDTTAAANGRYYNTNRTLTLTINEAFFNYVVDYANTQTIASITNDAGVNLAVHPSNFTEVSPNVWQYTYHFTTDADWTVSNVQVTDIVGRQATATGDSFTIDKTAPTMDVTFNTTTDNGYYNAARVATITVTEHNFDPSLVTINTTVAAGNGSEAAPAQVGGWTSNGDIHTATVTFPGQGVYTMSIEGADLALNALPSYSCPEFTVDTLTPEITLSGDVAAHADTRYAYAGDAGLGVAVHDTNIDGTRTTINVEKLSTPSDVNPYTANQTQTATDITKSFQNPSDITRDNDGVYRLTVQAVDLAGNTADQSVLWSVNRYGSTYVISADSEELLNTFTNADDLVDIQVTEINVDTLNEDQTAVELSRDTTSSTLARDDDYTVDHGQNESTGWQEYVYTVDQAAYSEDGAYRLLFHSEDSAANVSENTMPGKLSGGDADETAEVAFGVDSTAPVVSFVGTLDADTYQQASVPVTVNIEDNLALDHAQIIVNDEVVREIGSDELQGASNSFEFEVPESGERQSVRVVAYDVAGNETTQERSGLLINSNPFIQLINNTPLLIGCVVVIAAAIGGGVYLVGKRKKDEEK